MFRIFSLKSRKQVRRRRGSIWCLHEQFQLLNELAGAVGNARLPSPPIVSSSISRDRAEVEALQQLDRHRAFRITKHQGLHKVQTAGRVQNIGDEEGFDFVGEREEVTGVVELHWPAISRTHRDKTRFLVEAGDGDLPGGE